MEIWKKRRNLGKNLEILRIFGNLEKIEIWRNKFRNLIFFGNLEKIWKLGKNLEIWKIFGINLEIWKTFENFRNKLEMWKKF